MARIFPTSLAPQDSFLGAALNHWVLPKEGKCVNVEYHTSTASLGCGQMVNACSKLLVKSSLSCLTQSQAIHARVLFRYKDSPRRSWVTYEAYIHTPKSTLGRHERLKTTHKIPQEMVNMSSPIAAKPNSSYLIALAVGGLHFKAHGGAHRRLFRGLYPGMQQPLISIQSLC